MANYSDRDRAVIARIEQISINLKESEIIADDKAIKSRMRSFYQQIDTMLEMIQEDDGRDV